VAVCHNYALSVALSTSRESLLKLTNAIVEVNNETLAALDEFGMKS
jgi:hypothetical protein